MAGRNDARDGRRSRVLITLREHILRVLILTG